jgi:hypothetical protein
MNRIVAMITVLNGFLRPRPLVVALTTIVVILATLSVIGQYLVFRDEVGFRTRNVLFDLFNLDGERKIPTAFSAFLILGNAVLLFFITAVTADQRGRYVKHWFVLACIFVYLSYDEAVGIHESAFDPLMPYFGSEFLHFWVIPASIILVVLGLAYLRFLLRLPPATRTLFLLSAAIYIGGALGIETLGGLYAQQHGKNNMGYMLLSDVEEVAEMMGMILFTYALLNYLRDLLVNRVTHEAAS